MTVEFGPEQAKALERLASEFDTTKAGVLRYGLTLLLRAAGAARRGENIGIVRDGRVVNELLGPWNDLEQVRA